MEKKETKLYFENLDGLRFLCFLSVFFYHSFHSEIENIKTSPILKYVKNVFFEHGNLGVNFFFVLSGFLITYLLILEKEKNGKIDVKKFWLRRILRIWPLFYGCIFFGFVIFPLLKTLFGQTPNETANLWYYLSFINNFDILAHNLPDSSVLGVLWSVAIEEQFYLFVPLVLSFFTVKNYWIPFLSVLISSLIFRTVYQTAEMYEFHTLSCIGDMAIGGLGAWLINVSSKFKNRIENLGKLEILLIYLVFFFLYFQSEILSNYPYLRIFERAIIAISILFILFEQNFAKASFFKMSRFKWLSKLGVITYGLYCLHFIGILITTTLTKKFGLNTSLWQVMILETGISLILSIVIAQISYKFYEAPFLKLKDKFSTLL